VTNSANILATSLSLLVLCAQAARSEPRTTEGLRYTAVPLVSFSSDDGAGYGFRFSIYDHDGRSVPYRKAVSLQAYFATGGKWVHLLDLDWPHLRKGERVEIRAVYDRMTHANYFGGLSRADLDLRTTDQKTYAEKHPQLAAAWTRNLRGPWRVRLDGGLSANWLTPNTQEGSVLADQRPPGLEGGYLGVVGVALRYDTRDSYLNTTSGILEEARLAGRLGSERGGEAGLEHRHFATIGRQWVVAHRGSIVRTLGRTPFYVLPELGGSQVVRGLPKSCARGTSRVLFNAELRWQGVTVLERFSLRVGGLLFWDAGRVYNSGTTSSDSRWRVGGGAGLRIYWHSTVIRVDVGAAEGGKRLYMRFAHVF